MKRVSERVIKEAITRNPWATMMSEDQVLVVYYINYANRIK